jgi:hypothetical protein
MRYEHVQTGRLHWILYVALAMMLAGAWSVRFEQPVSTILFATAIFIAPLPLMFQTLTVRDEGDRLAVRFGPIGLFKKTIPYAEIKAFARDRSKWIDGWGIHCIPGRGWTYNLWGFDCVTVTVGSKTIRIGTDDPEGLVAFLTERLGPENNRA